MSRVIARRDFVYLKPVYRIGDVKITQGSKEAETYTFDLKETFPDTYLRYQTEDFKILFNSTERTILENQVICNKKPVTFLEKKSSLVLYKQLDSSKSISINSLLGGVQLVYDWESGLLVVQYIPNTIIIKNGDTQIGSTLMAYNPLNKVQVYASIILCPEDIITPIEPKRALDDSLKEN